MNSHIKGDAFQRTSVDSVNFVKVKDVGPAVKLIVVSDGKLPGSDWHLEFIQVTYTPAGGGEKVVTKFPYDKVITGDEKNEKREPGIELSPETR